MRIILAAQHTRLLVLRTSRSAVDARSLQHALQLTGWPVGVPGPRHRSPGAAAATRVHRLYIAVRPLGADGVQSLEGDDDGWPVSWQHPSRRGWRYYHVVY